MNLPLRPIRGMDRVAWIDAPLLCLHPSSFILPAAAFTPGRRYPATLADGYRTELEPRLAYSGELETVSICARDLVVSIRDDAGARHVFTGTDPAAFTFGIDGAAGVHSFADLARAFELPTVPTVGEMQPEKRTAALARLREIERRHGLSLRNFQREDLATAALVESLILAWDKGLGKTLAALAWPMVKGARHTLLVVPESLHEQTTDEARALFQIALAPLDLSTLNSQPSTPFTLAGYHQLARLTAAERAGLAQAFDCIVVDEATRLKSTDAAVAAAVRSLAIPLRLALSATPIKNKVADLFWLAAWIADARPAALSTLNSQLSTGLWPYDRSEQGRKDFSADFSATELSDLRDREKSAPRIADTLRLRRLLAPLILRRSKADCGERLVAKSFVSHSAPLSRAQALVYDRVLRHRPTHRNGNLIRGFSTVALQMQLLRQIALSPDTPTLTSYTLEGLPLSQLSTLNSQLQPPPTEKVIEMSRLIIGRLERGEQVLVFSPFLHFARTFHERLQAAGVSVCRMDGDISAKRRGALASAFKRGDYSVAICSLESMSAGISFPQCRTLLLPGLVWAFDCNDQAIDRIHRLVSEQDVEIHLFTAPGTIDAVLERDFLAKSAGSASILDGEPGIQLDPGAILAALQPLDIAATREDSALEREWEILAPRLRNAQRAFAQFHPATVPDLTGHRLPAAALQIERRAIRAALSNVSNPLGKAGKKEKASS